MTNANQLENTTELFIAAIKDKDAAVRIFNKYKNELYKEAMLFINDDTAARSISVQSFRNAYKYFRDADSSNPVSWLNQFVVEECVRRIPLEISGRTNYTNIDEIANKTAVIPSSDTECKNKLLSALDVLTPCQRLTSVLYFRDRLSIDEIAKKLHTSSDTVKCCISDAKLAIKAANLNLGSLIAILNRLYPAEPEQEVFDLQPAIRSVAKSSEYTDTMDKDMEFTTSVMELKEFFKQQKSAKRHLSDGGLDDEFEDESNSETGEQDIEQDSDDDKTQEIPVIDNDIQTKLYNMNSLHSDNYQNNYDEPSRRPVFKYVLIGLIAALLVVGTIVISMMIKSSKNNATIPAKTGEHVETEKAEENNEETSTPDTSAEPTPEPTPEASKSIGEAYILVSDLTIRKAPGVSNESNGFAEPESTYDVFETEEADGYTWYKIGDEQWVPDLAGQYISYTAHE